MKHFRYKFMTTVQKGAVYVFTYDHGACCPRSNLLMHAEIIITTEPIVRLQEKAITPEEGKVYICIINPELCSRKCSEDLACQKCIMFKWMVIK